MPKAVRTKFATAMGLPKFLASTGHLSLDKRKLIVDQALVLFEQNYAHLPLKRAMHAVDPVQRLRLLQHRLDEIPANQLPSAIDFHREMTEIFTSVRDLHTNYVLPEPFNRKTFYLPFMVEDYFVGRKPKPKYLVSHIKRSFKHPTFKEGVEVVYWNGVPIERAVMANAERYAGSNREARHARGVATLTTRPLIIALPPDEKWVDVGYRTGAGQLLELRVDWKVKTQLPPGGALRKADARLMAAQGIDLELDILHRTRTALFRPDVAKAERKAAAKKAKRPRGLTSSLPAVLQARPVPTRYGTFGYVRIRTFNVNDADAFVDEFVRLVSHPLLPKNGLIIDVRANGGGLISAGERLLQVLTPRRIEPELMQFINTPLNLRLCRRHKASSRFTDLSPWVPSMQQAIQTGAVFSAGFPITAPDSCNDRGQQYHGPVVLITDALCYSTTDIFAAGFEDHGIGRILGTDGNTGAGGANVWRQVDLREMFSTPTSDPQSPYKPLPNGAGMRVAMRRTLRVGLHAGTPVEDLGVEPRVRHFMTKDDLLYGNVDLIDKAASILARMPVRRLEVEKRASGKSVKVTVTTQGISRLDLPDDLTDERQVVVTATTQGISRLDPYVDGRPQQFVNVRNGQATFTVTKRSASPLVLRLDGFRGSQLVASRRVDI
jgi:C-terminal processing protease CtpA/Prc